MSAGSDIARIAGLVGEPARAEILLALMAGQALTATELAHHANITKQTASAHLSRLLKADLLRVESQGRHRYFRLAGKDIARLLEQLLGVAARSGSSILRSGPRDAGMRKARLCYDHLAGDLGVLMFDGLIGQGLLRIREETIEVTRAGQRRFRERGLDIAALDKTINIGAWDGDRLVGSVRLLSDGYFFCTVPEVMVDPEYRRKGIGKELLRRALDVAPGGTIFLGAQPGNEAFFEQAGFRRGPTGYVGRKEGSKGMF